MQNKEASASQYANLFFNPFGHDNLPTTHNDTPTSKMVKHGLGLAVGYGGVGLLARYLVHMKNKAQATTSDEKMKSYIAAKNPILSIDPSTRDYKREAKEKEIGVQDVKEEGILEKSAEQLGGQVAENVNSFGADTARGFMSGKQHDFHPALALAAALAGGVAGYSLMDKKLDTDTNKSLEDDIAVDENKIDKLLYDEYMKSRGLNKQAREPWTPSSSQEPATHTGNIADAIRDPKKIGNFMGSVAGLAALGIIALSYKASRDHFDESDPARQRLDKLKATLDEKGKMRGAPIFTDISEFPKGSSAKNGKGGGVGIQRKSENKNPVKDATPVDESDPYANLLSQE